MTFSTLAPSSPPSGSSPSALPLETASGLSWTRHLDPLLPPALALSVALLVLEVIALAHGQPPLEVLTTLWKGTWGTGYGAGQVLFKATPLLCTGLAVGVAFRAGLFNIGAEGQYALASLGMGAVGAALPASLPAPLAVGLCLMTGMGVGALWALPAGLLKARFGAHEVISTIMLNFIALAFSSYLVSRYLGLPETLHTAPISPAAELPRLQAHFPVLQGAPVNLALLLALLAALATGWLLFRTAWGYRLQTMGLSPSAAAYSGVRLSRMTISSLALSGALAGLGAASFVLGYKHYHEEGSSSGVGFLGIAVALLGRSHPAGMIAAALLFGTLSQGGLAINAVIPRESMEILQAVIILTVAAASATQPSHR